MTKERKEGRGFGGRLLFLSSFFIFVSLERDIGLGYLRVVVQILIIYS